MRARRRWLWRGSYLTVIIAAMGAVAALTSRGDGGGVGQLRQHDQHGAAACGLVRDWSLGLLKDDNGKPDSSDMVSMLTGADASEASTAAIRAAVIGPRFGDTSGASAGFETAAANLPQLRDACVAEGVKIGPLPSGP